MVVPWGGGGRGNSGGGNSGGGNSSGGNSAKGGIQIKLDSDPEQEGFQPSVSGELSVGVASADWSSETAELTVGFDVGFGRGGITIDTNTGEIVEQTAGFSLAGFFDYDVTELRCEKILTVRFKFLTGLIGWSYTEREFLKDKPGCELPEPEPDPEPTPDPGAPPPLPPLNDDSIGIFILGYQESTSRGISGSYDDSTGVSTIFLGKDFLPNNDYLYKLFSSSFASHSDYWNSANDTSDSASNEINFCIQYPGNETEWLYISPRTYVYYDVVTKTNKNFTSTSSYLKSNSPLIGTGIIVRGMSNVILFIGAWKTVREFITGYRNQPLQYGTYGSWNDTFSYEWNGETITTYNSGSRHWSLLYTDLLPEKIVKPKTPPLPPTPPQIDMDDCCKTTLKLLKEIHKALGVKRLLKQGFVVPNRLMMPRTSGTSTAKNFLEIAEIQLRVTDNLGIHPFNVVVKDADPTKKGDQPLYEEINSGSYALKEILQYLIDINVDGDANTNIAVRSAFLQTQMMTTLASQNQKIDAIIDGLGIGVKQCQDKVLVPFNPGVNNKAKGFDPKKAQVIDNNSEMTTEALLPDLLQSKELPFPTEKFIGKNDMMEVMYAIYAHVSKQ